MSSSREVWWVREDLCVFVWMCKQAPGSPFSQVFSSSIWLCFAFCSSECNLHGAVWPRWVPRAVPTKGSGVMRWGHEGSRGNEVALCFPQLHSCQELHFPW